MSFLCFFPLRHRASLAAFALIFCFALYSSALLADEPDLSIQQSVEQALSGNPGIAEIKSRAEALAAIPSQEGALPDPTLNFGMLNVPTRSFNLQKEDMTMIEVGLSQTIPFPGKLALKEKAAGHESLAAASSVEEARLRLARDVKKAWWRLFYYDRALNVTEETGKFFQQLVDVALAKYKTGQGTQQDVLMAQLELSKLKDEKLELTGMRHVENVQLNVLLNRKPETLARIPRQAEIKLPVLADAALQEKAMRSNPLFAQHDNMLDAARTKVELANKDYYPDLTLGSSYAFRQNTPEGLTRSDFLSVNLSINLPIYAQQKQAKAVDQRRSELLQEQYSAQDEHNKVHGEIAAKNAEYGHARERLALFEHEIIPQAEQTVRSLMAGYQVSKTDFTDLLRAQTTLFQYQSQYWQALARTQQVLAELTALVGEEVGHD
ncbi:MAG: TolC family protein [Candidatus Methylumidiphilus sp.]